MEEIQFSSNMNDIEINDRNIYNYDFLRNIILSENAYFEKEINKIKCFLDNMTDICENSSFVDKNIILALKDFIEKKQTIIIKEFNESSNL